MYDTLVKQLGKQEGVTEKLKATDMMLWVQKMNNIRDRATEIVNADIIYKVKTQRRQGAIPAANFVILHITFFLITIMKLFPRSNVAKTFSHFRLIINS